MNWKTDLKLSDLESSAKLEITCLKCDLSYYREARELKTHSQLHLDELEKKLSCSKRTCKGRVRLALTYQNKVEGFVGGLA